MTRLTEIESRFLARGDAGDGYAEWIGHQSEDVAWLIRVAEAAQASMAGGVIELAQFIKVVNERG